MRMSETAILQDREKPEKAAPVHNGCTLPGTASTGDATASPSPISKNRGGNVVNVTNGNAKLEALLERQKEIEARLAAEKLRLAKRKQKDDRKLFADVGREVCHAGERVPNFQLMVAQTLGGTVTEEKVRRFLTERGWLS
jgi:hypothetical protein